MEDLKLPHRTYTKINTLYKRNMESKNHEIIPGNYSDPEVEYLKDLPWECYLKIDGTNMHYQWDGHTLEIHGKTEKSNIPPKLKEMMENLVTVDMMKEAFPLKYDENGNEIPMMVRIYGEGCGQGIQGKCGTAYEPKGHRFIVFDILIDNWWLQRDSVSEICEKMNLEIVPLIGVMTLTEAEKMVKNGFKDSMAKTDLEAEGLVCRPLYGIRKRSGERIITKIKKCDYDALERLKK